MLLVDNLSPADRRDLLQELQLDSEADLRQFVKASPGPDNDLFGKVHMKVNEPQLLQYPHYQMHKHLMLYVPPVLLILGVLGNSMSFAILTRPAMRTISTYTYLAMLSIADTFVLCLGLLRLWIGEVTGFDIMDHADWSCKTVNAVGYMVSDYAVWLIVAVTVERFIAVCYPLKAPVMCNRTRAAAVMIGLWILLLSLNFHVFFTVQIKFVKVNGTMVGACHPAPEFEYLHRNIWIWVDAIIYSLLPFAVLCVFNGFITHKVLLAMRRRKGLTAESPSRDVHHRRQHHESIRLTVMLLTVSFAFLITTLPMIITPILNTQWDAQLKLTSDPDELGRLFSKGRLVRTITELLMYTNHSMNFFLYCATGQKFRQVQRQLLRCDKDVEHQGITGSTFRKSETRAFNRRTANGARALQNENCSASGGEQETPSSLTSEKNRYISYFPVKGEQQL